MVAITGSVGSGKVKNFHLFYNFCLTKLKFNVFLKSLFLQAILNEISHIKGSVKVNGKFFYVSQEPWLFPSSLKENILFGKPFEKEKFEAVIKNCFLIQVLLENIPHFGLKL